MKQQTDEWFAARIGLVTASRISDVMAVLKNGQEAATRKNYRAQLVAERLTGTKAESYSNAAMQWGTDNEPIARSAYEVDAGCFVDEVGFVPHPVIDGTGASPDGLVEGEGLVEIKCPNTATHIDYLIANEVPSEYQYQMLWQMECTGRKWCDFVSYDPRMPDDLQLFVIRFNFDEARVATIRQSVLVFLDEIDSTIEKLNNWIKL